MFSNLLDGRHLRAVSILPLSHLLEQISTLFFGTMMGAEVVYVRSRNPRVIFEAMRELRATAMVDDASGPGALLERHHARGQGARPGSPVERARAHRTPPPLPPAPARSSAPCTHSWVARWSCWSRPVRTCHQTCSRPGRTSASWSCRATARPSAASRSPTTSGTTPRDWSVVSTTGPRSRSTPTRARSWSRARRSPPATGVTRRTRVPLAPQDGWYKTGDTGYFTETGDLKLSGRMRNVIVLPNGLNVFPEDIEAALADHGLNQAVVLETEPGRIEAVVLPPGSVPILRADQQAANDRAVRRGPGGRDRRRGQGGQRRPLDTPAHRRLAPVAGTRLPPHAHAQDPPQRGPRLGRGQGRPAGPRIRRGCGRLTRGSAATWRPRPARPPWRPHRTRLPPVPGHRNVGSTRP